MQKHLADDVTGEQTLNDFFFLLSQKGMGAHQYILNNIIHRELRGILLLSMMRILFSTFLVYIHKSQEEASSVENTTLW